MSLPETRTPLQVIRKWIEYYKDPSYFAVLVDPSLVPELLSEIDRDEMPSTLFGMPVTIGNTAKYGIVFGWVKNLPPGGILSVICSGKRVPEVFE